MRECRAIQASLRFSRNARIKASTEDSVIRGFTKLMLLGNVRGALRVLSQALSGGIHPLQAQLDVNGKQRSVLDILKNKHWPAGGLVTSLTSCFRLCDSGRLNNKSANRGAAPQASYDRCRHQDCFPTGPAHFQKNQHLLRSEVS